MRIISVLTFFVTLFLSSLNTGGEQLRFQSLTNTGTIIISGEIDFNEFEASCTIKYTYDGDWIGGCSLKKSCSIFREYFYYAHLTYLDHNNKQLFRITLPDSLQGLRGIRVNLDWSGSDDNFVFREDIVYSADIQILSRQFFQFKELKELIRTKRVHKIQLELKKVVVKWYYLCESLQTKEECKEKADVVKKEGEFGFDVYKTYFIEVQYNNYLKGEK